MADRRFELAGESERYAEIVVQLGMIGPHGKQPQIRGDRLVEPPGTMRLGRQSQLLNEGIGVTAEQRRRRR
jgi:hypothetical protein